MERIGIYPHLDDSQLQKKITLKKEFAYKYDGAIESVAKKSKKICMKNTSFELNPHQEFVKRFISYNTPYNGLLLYHGLGSGKTCSASSMTESLRLYSRYIPNFKKILIIASPNVQENFKLQLFDPNKLTKKNGLWDLNGCVGNSLLNELNMYTIHDLSKEDVVYMIKKIIKDNYSFIGYVSFANFIKKCLDSRDKKKLKNTFESRVVVIDEIHNIRVNDQSSDSIGKKVADSLDSLVRVVKGIKLIFLTGTPMYNDPKEIVFLLNIFNLNDNRPTLKIKDVFTKTGELTKGGETLLLKAANGYVSYVRGENPYAFPYMVTPKLYKDPNSTKLTEYPLYQFNEKRIESPIEHLDLYRSYLSTNQENAYKGIIDDIYDKYADSDDFENLESLGYNQLLRPIQSLIITYPEGDKFLTSEEGLSYVMKYKANKSEFEYKKNELNGMFKYENIGNYSSKIKAILDCILNSKGIVLIYSQYIYGGIIPMALALEELGFKRYGDSKNSLLKEKNSPLNIYNLKGDPDYKGKNKHANYSIISGDIHLSPNNNTEIDALTINNSEGERVKVVLISQAGTEGIDLKNLRQVHVIEPWYNLNRIEQIIGRARRNCSHIELPLEERNVSLFLHCAYLKDSDMETIDGMIYRFAEKKSIKIGRVSRILKSVSVDCLLNQAQQNFANIKEVLPIKLSNGLTIQYSVKDEPFSSLCDYMETCEFSCVNKINEGDKIDFSTFSYSNLLNQKIIEKIKLLFNKRHVYRIDEILHLIRSNTVKKLEIIRTLNEMIEYKTPISDKFSKTGYITQIADLYLFQPNEISDPQILMHDRMRPIPIKPKYFKGELEVIKEERNFFDEIKELYLKATTEQNKNDDGDWYSLFYTASQHMINHVGIQRDKIDNYLITHLCEQCVEDEEVFLLDHLFSKEQLDEFETKLMKYYRPWVVEKEGVSAIGILGRHETHSTMQIYILLPELIGLDKKIWRKATLSEKHTFKDIYRFKKSPVADVIGFMGYFNDKKYQFKIKKKVVTTTVTGTYVMNDKKSDILNLINNDILKKNVYTIENTKGINRTMITVMAEIYMRYYDEVKSTRYFLSKKEYYYLIEKPFLDS